ncbi:hypothetical protein BB561_000182 [Smittium simulii]|uniref:Transcriptional regulatory protein RXT2 N-terminal domain-containing protein n=1 Tax=Smittium simulii TaxID=133385 RepID=A0A2T9Z043_9FUNG|nr:hypothetical protein BB561_000182 [Smittium simulii]
MYSKTRPKICPDYKKEFDESRDDLYNGKYGVDIQEILKPLEVPGHVISRPCYKKIIESNYFELCAYDLMNFIESEEKKIHSIRILLDTLINNSEEIPALDVISKNPIEQEAIEDIILKLNEVLMNQDELVYRLRATRDKLLIAETNKAKLRNDITRASKNCSK